MLREDLELSREDIQLISSRDALAAFFAKLGYDTNERLVQNVAAMGFSSDNLKFAIIHIERLAIESTTWVNVLSGLGYDRVRLVEINLAQMPEAGLVATQFDKARRYLDEGRYEECIAVDSGFSGRCQILFLSDRHPFGIH